MPGGDRTGPLGKGTMTGRRAGLCGGNDTAGYASAGGRSPGRGYGAGGKCGRNNRRFRKIRFGFSSWGAPVPEDERIALESQADNLRQSLDAINRRLKDMDRDDENQG